MLAIATVPGSGIAEATKLPENVVEDKAPFEMNSAWSCAGVIPAKLALNAPMKLDIPEASDTVPVTDRITVVLRSPTSRNGDPGTIEHGGAVQSVFAEPGPSAMGEKSRFPPPGLKEKNVTPGGKGSLKELITPDEPIKIDPNDELKVVPAPACIQGVTKLIAAAVTLTPPEQLSTFSIPMGAAEAGTVPITPPTARSRSPTRLLMNYILSM